MSLSPALLKQAGNQLRKIVAFSQNKHPDVVNEKIGHIDPQMLSADLQRTSEGLQHASDVLKDPVITSLFADLLRLPRTVLLREVHNAYISQLGPKGMEYEHKKPFSSLAPAYEILSHQLHELSTFVREEMVHYAKIKVQDFQLHTAFVVGVLVRSYDAGMFLASLIAIADAGLKKQSVPPFIKDEVLQITSWIGEFVTLLLNGHQTFVQMIKDFKNSGKNVSLIVQGTPFSEIMEPDDIPGKLHSGIAGFLTSDLMSIFLGKATQAERRQDRLEKQLIIKQWLDAQLLKARLDLHGTDPNSDEAKRLQKAIAAYELELANITKKINETPHE